MRLRDNLFTGFLFFIERLIGLVYLFTYLTFCSYVFDEVFYFNDRFPKNLVFF